MKAALSPCLFSCAHIIVLCLQTRTCGPERSLNDPNVSSFGMNPAKPEWLLIFIVCEWSIQKYIRYWNHCCLGYCMLLGTHTSLIVGIVGVVIHE